MKYWFDTEFIEDGKTIDLVSIGIVAEDGRELYLQNPSANFAKGNDWVWRNVYPHLSHFSLATHSRSCYVVRNERYGAYEYPHGGRCHDTDNCSWSVDLGPAIRSFCDPTSYGKPEFWAYYADYDWVALCQIFGTMMDLPEEWPMYCRDVKQLCDSVGNPSLPKQEITEHHALNDARWTKQAWKFLQGLPK